MVLAAPPQRVEVPPGAVVVLVVVVPGLLVVVAVPGKHWKYPMLNEF